MNERFKIQTIWNPQNGMLAFWRTAGSAPLVSAAVTGRVFVAKTPERFTYDADGNMTSDGRFTYTWNAENRMVSASNAEVVVTYAYDHRGRMVSKTLCASAFNKIHHLPLGRRKMLADRPAVCNNFLSCPNHSRRPGGRNGVQTDGVK